MTELVLAARDVRRSFREGGGELAVLTGVELQITRVKADKMGQLQRLDAAAHPEEFQRLNRELMMLEMERRALRSDA